MSTDFFALHNLYLKPWPHLMTMLFALACSLSMAQLYPARKLVTRAWRAQLEQATGVAVAAGAASWHPA